MMMMMSKSNWMLTMRTLAYCTNIGITACLTLLQTNAVVYVFHAHTLNRFVPK